MPDTPPQKIWIQNDFSFFQATGNGTYYRDPDNNSIAYVPESRVAAPLTPIEDNRLEEIRQDIAAQPEFPSSSSPVGLFLQHCEYLLTRLAQAEAQERQTFELFNRREEKIVELTAQVAAEIAGRDAELKQLNEQLIAVQLELAQLRVKPIVDNERRGENVDDIMNLRFTSGR